MVSGGDSRLGVCAAPPWEWILVLWGRILLLREWILLLYRIGRYLFDLIGTPGGLVCGPDRWTSLGDGARTGSPETKAQNNPFLVQSIVSQRTAFCGAGPRGLFPRATERRGSHESTVSDSSVAFSCEKGHKVKCDQTQSRLGRWQQSSRGRSE